MVEIGGFLFSTRVQTALDPTYPSVQWVPGLGFEHPLAHLTPMLKMSRAIPLLPPCIFMAYFKPRTIKTLPACSDVGDPAVCHEVYLWVFI